MDGLAVHSGSARYASTHQTEAQEIHDLKLMSSVPYEEILVSQDRGNRGQESRHTHTHTHRVQRATQIAI